MPKPLTIAPSILSADFANMGGETQSIKEAGADRVHMDVMDGSFVPPITFGSQMLKALRPYSSLPFDVHLMVEHPETHVDSFARAGADSITFHLEASTHSHRLLQYIQGLGKKAGISIVPSTPAQALTELFCEVDFILVMSVNPGYGGQQLIPQTLNKIAELERIREEQGFRYQISVDGGVNLETIQSIRASGVDIAVVGSAFFAQESGAARAEFVQKLRQH
ncbi:MAG: ribulose-phosphate 3-epimerase [Spirochaetota bacterium]